MIYEVTIPFKKGPWITYRVLAGVESEAEEIALRSAKFEGFTGKHGKITVKEESHV